MSSPADSPSPDPPAAHVVIRIPHILQAIIAACDTQTLHQLANTGLWVYEFINAACNDIKLGNVHLKTTKEGHIKYDPRRARISSPHLNCDSGLSNPDPTIDHQQLLTATGIEAIDLVGNTPIDHIGQDFLPDVVRLKANVADVLDYSPDGEDDDEDEFSYPRFMPRARCVVAFPLPSEELHDPLDWRWAEEQYYTRHEVEVLGDKDWVFDRAVCHPSTSYGWSKWPRALLSGPTTPYLLPAWHTLFLVQPPASMKPANFDMFWRMTHSVATALQAREHLAGAHVTIVIDCHTRYYLCPMFLTVTELIFCTSVRRHLDNGHNEAGFIREAMEALKFISWDQYRASISPRQFELETDQ